MYKNGKYCELTHERIRLQARLKPILMELNEIPYEDQDDFPEILRYHRHN